MRLTNWLKNAATIFTKQTAIVPGSGLSKKIMYIIAALGAAKLQAIEFESSKKILTGVRPKICHSQSLRSEIKEEKRGQRNKT